MRFNIADFCSLVDVRKPISCLRFCHFIHLNGILLQLPNFYPEILVFESLILSIIIFDTG